VRQLQKAENEKLVSLIMPI